MNRHLLHPALLHRLLQRMARNFHLDAMRADRLDVILVLPRHQWENLGAKSEWDSRKSEKTREAMKCIMLKHVLVGFLPVPHHPLWPRCLRW